MQMLGLGLDRPVERVAGLVLAFVGCVLIFFTSPKAKDEKMVVLSLIAGSIALGYGLKLMVG